MSRDSRLFLEDILSTVADLRSYVAGATRSTLDNDAKTRDAVIRCLEVIGEAVKRLPQDSLSKYPDVDWAGFARMRDILSHQYFGVDLDIVWDVIEKEIPLIERRARELLADSP